MRVQPFTLPPSRNLYRNRHRTFPYIWLRISFSKVINYSHRHIGRARPVPAMKNVEEIRHNR